MYTSALFTVSAALSPLVLGSVFGSHGHKHLNARNPHSALHSRGIPPRAHQSQFRGYHPKPSAQSGALVERAAVINTNIDGLCGPGVGSCADGICCSPSGWCGTGKAYCAAPDCQIDYGPGCDANQSPPGSSTSGVARPQSNSPSIVYGGAGVYSCTKPGTVAITYDDGPYIYTQHVLDLYDKYNAKATFFITGNNLGKGKIDDTSTAWPGLIKRMHSTGHQIGSHTWSHQDLSTLTTSQLQDQIYLLEMAVRNILGFFPTYMRPPFSSCGAACQKFLNTAGYHIIYFDQDTSDYLFDSPELIQISKDYITTNLTIKNDPSKYSFLVVGHDIDQQEAYNLTEFMLQSYTDKGYKMVTVGECLGDAVSNWYRTAGGAGTYSSTASKVSSSTALPSATGVSTDAVCGAINGRTCLNSGFGNCCSVSGWCGSTTDHCGAGCQAGYGTCGSSSLVPSAAVSSLGVSALLGSGKSVVPSVLPSAVVSSVASAATGTSTDGTCGSLNKLSCLNSGFGNCCSVAGWCGSTTDHCGTGCQAGYGTCGSNSVAASVATSGALGTKVVSGASSIKTASAASSGAKSASAASAAASSLATGTSTDGTCGALNKMGCLNSGFGNCCSVAGWCGSTTDHCGTGCQSGYGTCGSNSVVVQGQSSTASPVKSVSSVNALSVKSGSSVRVSSSVKTSSSKTSSSKTASSARASSSAKATSSAKAASSAKTSSGSIKLSSYSFSSNSTSSRTSGTASFASPLATVVSTDGQCGPSVKTTCLKSEFGDCCSMAGWCGSTDPYCGTGCQAGYGSCK